MWDCERLADANNPLTTFLSIYVYIYKHTHIYIIHTIYMHTYMYVYTIVLGLHSNTPSWKAKKKEVTSIFSLDWILFSSAGFNSRAIYSPSRPITKPLYIFILSLYILFLFCIFTCAHGAHTHTWCWLRLSFFYFIFLFIFFTRRLFAVV